MEREFLVYLEIWQTCKTYNVFMIIVKKNAKNGYNKAKIKL
jgi:hypothetical protein